MIRFRCSHFPDLRVAVSEDVEEAVEDFGEDAEDVDAGNCVQRAHLTREGQVQGRRWGGRG